ncbi:uncharacterized protein [Ptychodera flava]|uniref:uncharacterized protein n=1 Tax=Ptychodera flava TaxID=63121 RepID=UPI003969FD26
MPPGKCVFNDLWLKQPEYLGWLERAQDKSSAKCKLCEKTFDVSNMGEAALKSHAKGVKHQALVGQKQKASGLKIKDFFAQSSSDVKSSTYSKPSTSSSDFLTSHSQLSMSSAMSFKMPSIKPVTSSLTAFVSKNDVLRAEVLWTLKVVKSHYSFNSCGDIQQLFSRMFPDSEIAKQFTCGERKCAYLCNYGIAPYFKQLLTKKINDEDGFVLLFDESLNHKTRKKQMDFHARIWEDEKVKTLYYSSSFMGHATAEDMVEHFDECTEGLNKRKMLQISMDGPNVNWKFHRLMQNKQTSTTDKSLLNVGSCGLHIVHGAFKDGAAASGWPIQDLLKSLYYLFKDTPARREDYFTATGSDVFPMKLKFCSHRWVENLPVSERAVQIWPNVVKYVSKVTKGDVPNPKTTSYNTVVSCTKDNILTVKLLCFQSIAKLVAPFLLMYQTDKPMMPFLADDLHRLLTGLLKRFVKGDVIEASGSLAKIVKLDLQDKKIYTSYSKVDLGFSSELELRKVKSQSSVSDRQVMQLRMECRDFLVKTATKLIEKSPLKYPMTRAMSCLDPRQLASSKDDCLRKMKRILTVFVEAGQMTGGASACDEVLRQFEEFVDTVVASNHSTFQEYNPYENRLDELLYQSMETNPHLSLVWKVVKSLLLISHRQASVERGFSVNRQIEVENLHEESVVAQRLICDQVDRVGGIQNVQISAQLLTSAGSARHRYQAHLDEEKKKRETAQAKRKRKDLLSDIEDLKVKKKRLQSDVTELMKSADEYADKAEATRKITFITKSNSLRR